jgi:hypothetical protein
MAFNYSLDSRCVMKRKGFSIFHAFGSTMDGRISISKFLTVIPRLWNLIGGVTRNSALQG